MRNKIFSVFFFPEVFDSLLTSFKQTILSNLFATKTNFKKEISALTKSISKINRDLVKYAIIVITIRDLAPSFITHHFHIARKKFLH